MKKIFNVLICFAVLFLFVCPQARAQQNWEIWTQIKANLTTEDDGSIIITYHLGPVLIVDNIQVSKSWVHFIRSDAPLYIRVHVTEDNSGDCSRGLFRYYIEENFINPSTCCSPIDFSSLERNADDIPGFIWNDKPSVEKVL
jgi:hypothetical protein